MKSTIQKKLAAKIAKVSTKRVALDTSKLEDIKEAVTKQDVRALLADGAISIKPKKGISRGNAKKRQEQRVKKRRRGQGTRKGKATARLGRKEKWMAKVRLQRVFLKELKLGGKIDNEAYRMLYSKSKGGFFRSKRHIKLYINEHDLVKNDN